MCFGGAGFAFVTGFFANPKSESESDLAPPDSSSLSHASFFFDAGFGAVVLGFGDGFFGAGESSKKFVAALSSFFLAGALAFLLALKIA